MLLQSIVLEIDRHLNRLVALRKIVASLKKTPAVVRNLPVDLPTPLQAEPASLGAPKRSITPRRRQSPRKTPSVRKISPEVGPLVLSSSIPAGPVVVSPRQLQEERERRVAMGAQTAVADLPVKGVDLDEMSRSLSARWFMGSVQ